MKPISQTVLVVTLLLSMSLVASAKGNLELVNKAFVEREEVAKDGSKQKVLGPATKVVPGEEVLFVITYRNKGAEPATDIVITNPIPKNMTYRSAESDRKDLVSEVSVDGGKKFGDLASLKASDKLRKNRPALPSDVTHVRWVTKVAMKPNEEGKVQLRAVLK